jgi:type II secretory pathway predicted ATPase ExeA
MNLTRFQLRMRPFPTTPDAQFYYPASSHEAALNALACAIDDQEGLALLTGEPGTGKTLLAHLLLQRLGSQFNTALITNCRFSSIADMHRAVLFDLGRPFQGMGEEELRLALADYILNQFAEGRPTVLIFDEAQDLTPELLEEIRLLGNLEAGRGKAVQAVLIALPSILDTLARSGLAALNQRLAVRLNLDALDLHESADYLLHQVRLAGGQADRLFSDEAISVLAKNARGTPRLLNRFAYQALALAEQIEADLVDVEVALEALSALGIEPEIAEEHFPTRPTLASDLAETSEEEEILGPAAAPIKPIRAAYLPSRPPLDYVPTDSPRDPATTSEAFVVHSPGQPVEVVYGDA